MSSYGIFKRFLRAFQPMKNYSTEHAKKALILGVYQPQEKDGQLILTPTAGVFNDRTNGQLQNILSIAGRKLKPGQSKVLYGLGEQYSAVAIANIGKMDLEYCAVDQLYESRENVRSAVSSACRQLRAAGDTTVVVDPCADPEAAAEGSLLSLYVFDELKATDQQETPVSVTCHTDYFPENRDAVDKAWKRGVALAKGQNFARRLMDSPANRMTPTIFCNIVQQQLQHSCSITARDHDWVVQEKMEAFLSVAQGSHEPLRFIEIDYNGAPTYTPPVALVGKGITFDSGGISLKPAFDMDKMRGDMGGAACVVGAILASALLKLPINIKGLIALCENMPSGKALKPGDVVIAKNRKSIQVDNTDAEGRLVLADVLCYAETFNPSLILDIATLTGAASVALGAGAAAAYTNCDLAWHQLHQSGGQTGDRVWRMPLFTLYRDHVTKGHLADMNNVGKYPRSAGSCTAAAFLKEFVTNDHWVHLDIAGVFYNKDEVPYLAKGMSGRPTRTIVDFLQKRCSHSSGEAV